MQGYEYTLKRRGAQFSPVVHLFENPREELVNRLDQLCADDALAVWPARRFDKCGNPPCEHRICRHLAASSRPENLQCDRHRLVACATTFSIPVVRLITRAAGMHGLKPETKPECRHGHAHGRAMMPARNAHKRESRGEQRFTGCKNEGVFDRRWWQAQAARIRPIHRACLLPSANSTDRHRPLSEAVLSTCVLS
eukprot:4622927-Pleurochrysis_carterae.AAC.1